MEGAGLVGSGLWPCALAAGSAPALDFGDAANGQRHLETLASSDGAFAQQIVAAMMRALFDIAKPSSCEGHITPAP